MECVKKFFYNIGDCMPMLEIASYRGS